MKKFVISSTFGCIVLIGALFQFFWCLKQPLIQAGFFWYSGKDSIIIESIVPKAPAWNAGLRIGDQISSINDISAQTLIQARSLDNAEDLFHLSENLFTLHDTYSIKTADGIIHRFTLTPQPLLISFQAIPRILKVNFFIALIFIIFGFLLTSIIKRENNIFLYCLFLFSAAITIINSYGVFLLSAEYTAVSRLLLDISSVITGGFFIFFMLSFFKKLYFYKLIKTIVKIVTAVVSLCMICILFLQYVDVINHFSRFALYKSFFALVLLFLIGIIGSIYMITRITHQPVFLLRFILLGFLMGSIPLLVDFVFRIVSSSFFLSSSYQVLYVQLSYLFIPISTFIAVTQFKDIKNQQIASNVLIFLMYVFISVMFTQVFYSMSIAPKTFFFTLYVAITPFAYIALVKFTKNFLYPPVRQRENLLNSLEEKLFSLGSAKEVFEWTAKWIMSIFNAGFVQIVSVDEEGKFNLLYGVENTASLHDIALMRSQRNCATEKNILMRHGRSGISIPIFKTKKLFGYFFVGSKLNSDEYSAGELSLFFPVGRILMQSLLFFNALEMQKQKIQLQSAFSRYLSPDLVDEIMVAPDEVRVGGEKRVLTAFFTDLEDFSSISEQMDPNALVRLINMYLNEMSAVILSLGGTIDKFEGDAIMAFFGAPNVMPDHAINACLAALRMKKMEEILNMQILKENLCPRPLFTRIGINTGEVIVGNMGSLNRLDYTIIGNEVNIAARLEAANKKYHTSILISSQTYQYVFEYFACRRLPAISMKGVSKPVNIYELIEESNKISAEQRASLTAFNEGIVFFEEKKYNNALECFSAAHRHCADNFSQLFIAECTSAMQ